MCVTCFSSPYKCSLSLIINHFRSADTYSFFFFFNQTTGHSLSLVCPCLKRSPASLYPSATRVSSCCAGAVHQIKYGTDLKVQTSGLNICHTSPCRRRTVLPVEWVFFSCRLDRGRPAVLTPFRFVVFIRTFFQNTWPHDWIWHMEGGGNRGGGCCLIPPTMKVACVGLFTLL